MTDRAGTLRMLDRLIGEHTAAMRALAIRGRDPVLPDYERAEARARRGYESGFIEGLRAARDLLERQAEADQDNHASPDGRRQ